MRGAGRSGARCRPVRDAAAVAVAAAALPSGWTWNDPAAHLVGATVVLVVGLLVLVARARAEQPARAYADALERAGALHVHLTRARVVCRSDAGGTALLAFTWHGVRTDLLDADGLVLHTVLRNCLDSGYTVTVPVDDPHVAELVSRDRFGGTIDIYAAVDVVAHPEGGIAAHGVVRDGYGLVFASWSGALTARGSVARAGSHPF